MKNDINSFGDEFISLYEANKFGFSKKISKSDDKKNKKLSGVKRADWLLTSIDENIKVENINKKRKLLLMWFIENGFAKNIDYDKWAKDNILYESPERLKFFKGILRRHLKYSVTYANAAAANSLETIKFLLFHTKMFSSGEYSVEFLKVVYENIHIQFMNTGRSEPDSLIWKIMYTDDELINPKTPPKTVDFIFKMFRTMHLSLIFPLCDKKNASVVWDIKVLHMIYDMLMLRSDVKIDGKLLPCYNRNRTGPLSYDLRIALDYNSSSKSISTLYAAKTPRAAAYIICSILDGSFSDILRKN